MSIAVLLLIAIYSGLYKNPVYSWSLRTAVSALLQPKQFLYKEIEKFQVFIDSYKQSNYYWVSAFLGALYGSTKIVLIPEHSTKLIVSIFFVPPIFYLYYYRPWGLECEYRSVDSDSGGINALKEDKNIANLSDGGAKLDFIINTADSLSIVKIKFKTSDGLIHTLQTHKGDQIGDGKLRIEEPSSSSSVSLKLSKRKDNYKNEPVVVIDLRSGRTLCSVDVIE